MSLNKILSLAASTIKSTILFLLIFFHSNISSEEVTQYNPDDQGVLSIMYHRFEENKYPSTNIRMNIFLEHIAAIKNNGFEFYNPKLFSEEFDKPKDNKKILLTIDDAFLSFYENAWPILKKNEIPFILFVSTEPIGKRGYMTWEQIKEIEIEKFKTEEYWTISADFKDENNNVIQANLSILNDEKVEKFSFKDSDTTNITANELEQKEYHVTSVTSQKRNRNPYAPFTTSTLQQSASTNLKISPRDAMSTAQNLYEAGLITYTVSYTHLRAHET